MGSIAIFLLVMLSICLGVYLWVRRAKDKKRKEHEHLVKVATGAGSTLVLPGSSGTLPGGTSGATAGNGASEEIELLPKPVMSATAAVAYGGKLREKLKALLEAWRVHQESWGAWGAAASEQSLAKESVSNATRRSPETVDRETFALRLRERYERLAKARNEVEKLRPDLHRPLNAVVGELNALSELLKRVEGYAQESFPPGLYPVVEAARHVRDSVKIWVESRAKMVKESQEKGTKKKSKGPDASSVKGDLDDLAGKFDTVVAAHAEVELAKQKALAVVEQLDSRGAKSDFHQPQRPTEEEVGLYLREVEVWAEEMLPAARSSAEKIEEFEKPKAAYLRVLEEFQAALKKVSYLSSRDVAPEVEAAVEAASVYQRKWGESLPSELHAQSNEFSALQLKKSAPVATCSAAESEVVDLLRKLARKVGFAIAQQNVAYHKWEAAKNQIRPSLPSQPGIVISGTMDVDKLFLDFDVYVSESGRVTKERERIAAEVAVILSAWEARREQTGAARDLLNDQAQAALKQKHSGTADKLRVALLASLKHVDLLKNCC